MPDRRVDREHSRAANRAVLRGQDHQPPVHPVSEQPAEQRGQDQRPQLHQAEQADDERLVGELVCLVGHRHVGDHRPGEAGGLAAIQPPEVGAMPQRPQVRPQPTHQPAESAPARLCVRPVLARAFIHGCHMLPHPTPPVHPICRHLLLSPTCRGLRLGRPLPLAVITGGGGVGGVVLRQQTRCRWRCRVGRGRPGGRGRWRWRWRGTKAAAGGRTAAAGWRPAGDRRIATVNPLPLSLERQ